jgi:hypothetical protein
VSIVLSNIMLQKTPWNGYPRAPDGKSYSCEDVDQVIFAHLHWTYIFYMEKFTVASLLLTARNMSPH